MSTAVEETVTTEKPKATKKARVGAQGADVAPKKGKRARRPASQRKRLRPRKSGCGQGRQQGRKDARFAETSRGRDAGSELMQTTGWQAHSVRGFLSGTVRKKLGLTVESAKGENGERNYSIKA